MLQILFVAAVLQCCLAQQYQGKVAPGVPPQQYQAPPPPQQQYQPPPPQQQQVPVQPQYQQAQHQQQPPQQVYQQQQPHQPPQGHHAHAHHGDAQMFNAANIAQERDHIKEHMEVPMDTSKMSEQELQFHYFKMHDSDNNNMLDGCELIKSLIHWHDQGHKQAQTNQPPPGEKIFADNELINLIDPILNMDDHNWDGYIDYAEFVRAQQKSQQQDGKQ